MDNKESSNVNIDTISIEPPVTTKRYLTEAQKLAFLKGREKRMANIERRKQEKLEAENAAKEDNQEREEKSTPVVNIKTEKVEVVPDAEPVIETESINDSDIQAKKIADMIFERLKSQVSADNATPIHTVPPSPPKAKLRKPYVKKNKPPPRVIEEDTEENHGIDDEPPVAPIIPKKGISWM
jgi:hypothetical protein